MLQISYETFCAWVLSGYMVWHTSKYIGNGMYEYEATVAGQRQTVRVEAKK